MLDNEYTAALVPPPSPPPAQVAGAHDGVGGPSMGWAEASDVLSYVVDVAVCIGSLLQGASHCCTAARNDRRGGDGGSVGGGTLGGGGGIGGGSTVNGGGGVEKREEVPLLAFRLQGADGGVAPEGLAAALALAYEATLPALEGLLHSADSGKVGGWRETGGGVERVGGGGGVCMAVVFRP